jgi:chromosome segregation ATPase
MSQETKPAEAPRRNSTMHHILDLLCAELDPMGGEIKFPFDVEQFCRENDEVIADLQKRLEEAEAQVKSLCELNDEIRADWNSMMDNAREQGREEMRGRAEAAEREVERLGKEVEELMQVDYWQDRYKIERTAHEATQRELEETERRNGFLSAACDATNDGWILANDRIRILHGELTRTRAALEKCRDQRDNKPTSYDTASEYIGWLNQAEAELDAILGGKGE